jgi:hypothetical protein
MKSLVLFLLTLSSLLAARVSAAPAIGATVVTPSTIVINTPTNVLVTAVITDPSLIAPSVNLLRLDNTGGVIANLGTLHDDGLNGDLVAGDKEYSLSLSFNEPSATQIRLQVSAAFRGVLARVRLDITSVFAQSANAPDQTITALANNLVSGDVAPSEKTTRVFAGLDDQARRRLASLLLSGQLVISRDDLRIYHAPWLESDGTITQVEFSLAPNDRGDWVIISW